MIPPFCLINVLKRHGDMVLVFNALSTNLYSDALLPKVATE